MRRHMLIHRAWIFVSIYDEAKDQFAETVTSELTYTSDLTKVAFCCREPDTETPHIMVIENFFLDKTGQQQIYGNYFYRPNETFHLATRKFLQKEVFKSDFNTSISPSEIIGKCYVMHVRDYFKYKPEVMLI